MVTWRLSSLASMHEAAEAARLGARNSVEAAEGGSDSAIILLLDLPPFLAQHATDELEYGMQEGFIPYVMVSSVWSGTILSGCGLCGCFGASAGLCC
jgi:hypothetical protein